MRKKPAIIYFGMFLIAGQMLAQAGEETVVATNTLSDLIKTGEQIQKVEVFKLRLESAVAVRVSGGMGGVFLPRGVKWETDATTKELAEGNPIYGNRDYQYGVVPPIWRGLKVVQGMADQKLSFRITFPEPVNTEIYIVNPKKDWKPESENLKVEIVSRILACFHVPPAPNPMQTDSLSVWNSADKLTGFLKYPADTAVEASPATTAAFMHDEQFLYFICRASVHDKYKLAAAAEGKDGNLWSDDIIEMFLQTRANGSKFYHLAFNSRGALWDAADDVGGDKVKNDTSWDSGAEIVNQWMPDAAEWIARVKIPFKSFGLTNGPPETPWQINVCRESPEYNYMSWSFLGKSRNGFLTPEAFMPMVFSGINSNQGLSFPGKVVGVYAAERLGLAEMARKTHGEYNEVALGQWIVKGTAEARPNGPIVLKDRDSAAEQNICLTNIARHRFVCTLRCRSDEQDIPVWLSFFYRDAKGVLHEIRAFEYAQTLPVMMVYKEEIVFPESAGTLEKIRLSRAEHAGSVEVDVKNVMMAAASNAYDFVQRRICDPFPVTSHPRAISGPTRFPAEGTAEMFFWSQPEAIAVDVPAPLHFGLNTCASHSNAPKGRVVFDLPPEIPDPYLLVRAPPGTPGTKDGHFCGKPEKTGQSTVDGIAYTRYAAPIELRHSSGLIGSLYVQAHCAPGSAFRIGYFLEWDGGAQAERWLDVEAISIPDGPSPKKFIVATWLPLVPWGAAQSLPGFIELWRRSGMNTAELGDLNQNTKFRIPTVKFFRDNGIRVSGSFSPGYSGGYQSSLEKNPAMQGKGADGKTVILEHGRLAACPSYQGEENRKQLELLRDYVRLYRIDIINHDDEFFVGNANYCFCDRCKGLFKKHLQKNNLPELALEEIVKNKTQHPEHYKAWIQFRADFWTEWFRDYRKVVDEEWAKISPTGRVEMYTCGSVPSDYAKESQLQDHATWLKEGLVQRLVPQLYVYAPQYKGVPQRIGPELIEMNKKLDPYRKGSQALFIYLHGGTGGFCMFYPPEFIKYEVLEAFTAGAINGFCFYPHVGDPWHWKYLAEALHAVAKVEDILWDGKVEVLPCALPSASARVIRKGNEAVLFVSEYGYDPVEIPIVLPVKKASRVTDVETGALVAEVKPGQAAFNVRIDKQRVRLLKVTSQPSFFEKLYNSIFTRK